MSDKDVKSTSVESMRAELERAQAELQALRERAARPAKDRKANYSFVSNGVLGEKQIEIPCAIKALEFLPSASGKRLVHTIGVQFPGGISGQLVLTKKS